MNGIEKFIYYVGVNMPIEHKTYYMICIYILAGLLGAVIGSFLNVVIYRIPAGLSLSMPPSHCPQCKSKIKWYDNIPIVSYILLGAKCRNCKVHIPIRYTIVEATNMILYLLCAFVFIGGGSFTPGISIESAVYGILCMLACSVLLCVAFIDLEHTYIPDRLQIILASLGVLAIVANLIGFNDGISWLDRVIGAGGSLVLFLIIYFVGMLVYKREAMGIGDIKLVTAAGLLLGWKNMIVAIFIGVLVGAIVLAVVRRARDDEKQHEYPFGPFLVIGMLIAMFAGEFIIKAYLTLF